MSKWILSRSGHSNRLFVRERESPSATAIALVCARATARSRRTTARLIAAAPELYEALRALVMADRLNVAEWSAAARQADAALAKADGADSKSIPARPEGT